MKTRKNDVPANAQVSDEPETLGTQAREAVEKNATELRKQRLPIATEPPTVYRP